MQKVVIALILFSVALASAIENVSSEIAGINDYHRKIGIPLATRLRKAEEAILNKEDGQRIVGGGGTTLIYLHPYQAGLVITVFAIFTSVCGGTTISDNTVLTAAHCVSDPNLIADSITAVLGSNFIMTSGHRVAARNVIIHPSFSPSHASSNIALVRVPTVTFTLAIQPIALPSGSEINLDFTGWRAVASGYGLTHDGGSIGLLQGLSSVNLEVISNDQCRSVYGHTVQDDVLCTSGLDGGGICGGDFGGPLTVNSNGRKILIGIASFHAESGCAARMPSGFTRITSFVPWILSN